MEKDTRLKAQIAQDELDAKYIGIVRDKLWKFFDEEILTSDIPFHIVELMPQYLTGAIKITQGKSKEWEKINKDQDKFFKTPINKLELYEDLPEDKKED